MSKPRPAAAAVFFLPRMPSSVRTSDSWTLRLTAQASAIFFMRSEAMTAKATQRSEGRLAEL